MTMRRGASYAGKRMPLYHRRDARLGRSSLAQLHAIFDPTPTRWHHLPARSPFMASH